MVIVVITPSQTPDEERLTTGSMILRRPDRDKKWYLETSRSLTVPPGHRGVIIDQALRGGDVVVPAGRTITALTRGCPEWAARYNID